MKASGIQPTTLQYRATTSKAGNQPNQSDFRCLNCGHEANADINAAENIRRQGIDILARAGEPLGVPPPL